MILFLTCRQIAQSERESDRQSEGESLGTILGLHIEPCDLVLAEMFALEGCVPYL
jgi:hypothetical protein